MLERVKNQVAYQLMKLWPQYRADGLAVSNRNLSFMEDQKFNAAWKKSELANKAGWGDSVPDVRWRAHVACWATSNALRLEGDFVECGVFTGLLSVTVCHFHDFSRLDRRFFLFDTFDGIPLEGLSSKEARSAQFLNEHMYFDCWQVAQKNFSPFPNAILVRGRLPDSLDQVAGQLSKIAYLSIDLNGTSAEHGTITRLWDHLVPGAIVLLDDYGFAGHEEQHEMWNRFAKDKGTQILTMPTGQGLLIKLD